MSTSLFPLFRTFLLPAVKTAKLAFVKMGYDGNANNLPTSYEELPAEFSRVDIGDTSGATVLDANRNLVELPEDVPDWSFPSVEGCQSLLMRPQVENLYNTPKNTTNNTFSANLTFDANAILAPNGELEGASATTIGGPTVTQSRYDFIVPTNEADYTFLIFIHSDSDADLLDYRIRDQSNGINIKLGLFTTPLSGWNIQVIKFTKPAGCTSLRIFLCDNNTALAGNTLYSWGFTLATVSSLSTPVYGTRNSNSFQLADLISKGVIGSNEGSFIVNINVDIMPRINSQVYLIIGDTTNGFALGNSTIVGDVAIRTYVDGVFTQKFTSGGELKVLFTYKNGSYKVFINDKETPEISGTENLTLNTPNLVVNGISISYLIRNMAFAPKGLTDAEAVAALNSL